MTAGSPRFLSVSTYVFTSMNEDADAEPGQITVVLNWFEELQRLVPSP